MDMDSTNTTTSMSGMTPFLHFTLGDYFFFKTWKPLSPGAVVAACIGLFCLAILDRWLSAVRGVLSRRWRHKDLALASTGASTSTLSNEEVKRLDTKNETSEGPGTVQSSRSAPVGSRHLRSIPPFVLAHDIPRGLLHGVQSLLTYALMLAVMTFNASYIIAIIVGLGVGEVIFGRIGGTTVH